MNLIHRFLVLGIVLLQLLTITHFSPSSNGFNPIVNEILSGTNQNRWMEWIAALSGEMPIETSDGFGKILTRSSLVMFEPGDSPNAFIYLQTQLDSMGFIIDQDYEIHTYAFPYGDRYPERNWKNLILTFPGSHPTLKSERVLLVAHLDSISDQETVLAPGADDNASGAAGLLEAAAVFRHFQFERTIHLVWFSGEEQSRVGSEHFVRDFAHWLPDIIGVINMDMFAFDWDNDRCFEIHAGVLPGSGEIANLFGKVIEDYHLNLTFDLIDDDTAYSYSDHKPFWDQGIPAVMVYENGFFHAGKTCNNSDRNTTYHTTADRIIYLNPETGFSIVKAAMGTLAHMANPIGQCFTNSLDIEGRWKSDFIFLEWNSLQNAVTYQIWKMEKAGWHLLGETKRLTYFCSSIGARFAIVALSNTGCQSYPEEIILNSASAPTHSPLYPINLK